MGDVGWNQCLGEGKEYAIWDILADSNAKCTASLKIENILKNNCRP